MSTHPIHRARRAAALAAALLLSSACATKGDLRNVTNEMRAMSVRQDSMLVALARQNATTRDTIRRQTDQLFEIRGDVSRLLDQILDELATLRELTGQNQRTIASVRDQLEGLRRGGLGAVPAAGSEAVLGASGEESVAPGGGAADATYNVAVEQYQRGSLGTAERAFQSFLTANPNHALAPDARFFRADILEQQGNPRDALAAFNQIPELHPTSTKVPDALYRSALLLLELGNRQEARRLLERVVNTYPESLAAGPARERLREIQ